MNRFPNFMEITAGSFIDLALRYGLLAGLAWLLGYVFFKRRWLHRKIITRFPDKPQLRREIAYSALSLVIFSVTGALTIQLARYGWTQLYWRIGDHGWVWFWTTVVLTIFLHDAWFYWTHRLIHHRRLFRHCHRVHHLSHNPSPWAAYAFDPVEAVLQSAIWDRLMGTNHPEYETRFREVTSRSR